VCSHTRTEDALRAVEGNRSTLHDYTECDRLTEHAKEEGDNRHLRLCKIESNLFKRLALRRFQWSFPPIAAFLLTFAAWKRDLTAPRVTLVDASTYKEHLKRLLVFFSPSKHGGDARFLQAQRESDYAIDNKSKRKRNTIITYAQLLRNRRVKREICANARGSRGTSQGHEIAFERVY
jgi:hypothetical protein